MGCLNVTTARISNEMNACASSLTRGISVAFNYIGDSIKASISKCSKDLKIGKQPTIITNRVGDTINIHTKDVNSNNKLNVSCSLICSICQIVGSNKLLLEDGGYVLLEDGYAILLEE